METNEPAPAADARQPRPWMITLEGQAIAINEKHEKRNRKMSKVLRTAAVIVAVAALAVATYGASIGPTAAAAAGSAGVAGLSVAAVGTALTVAGTGLGLVAGLTAKKPSAASAGNPEQFAADPNAFIPIIIGRVMGTGAVTFLARDCSP